MSDPRQAGRDESGRDKDERDKDERIRLLEYQSEFLRRETEAVTRRYHDIIHSAAWTIARPVKRLEDALHRLVGRFRAPQVASAPAIPVPPAPPPTGSGPDAIAARIAAQRDRPPADR